MIDARFGHVNLIARDWRALAAFYQRVLGCPPVPPERDLRGEALSAATGVANAALRGIHPRLPGAGPVGPTLQAFEDDPSLAHPSTAANRPRFAHVAFVVPEAEAARATTPRRAERRSVTWPRPRQPTDGTCPGATSGIRRATSSSCRPGRRPDRAWGTLLCQSAAKQQSHLTMS